MIEEFLCYLNCTQLFQELSEQVGIENLKNLIKNTKKFYICNCKSLLLKLSKITVLENKTKFSAGQTNDY